MLALIPLLVLHPSAPETDRLAWFRNDRIGMFIHWGPVTLRGAEIGWSRGDSVPTEEYDALYKRFNPVKFNAGEWMRIARQAGMRYVVPTARHHDGFCLWPSKFSDYTIAATPFKRDVMGEIAKAAKRNGIDMCTYYSILDWRHPDYGTGSPGGRTVKPNADMDRYMKVLEGELTELVQNYGVKMVWFDGGWEAPWTRQRSIELDSMLRKLSPSLILNNRNESSQLLPTDPHGDYGTPEQTIGTYDTEHPWETCMTLGSQWAFSPTDHYKTPDQVLSILIQTVTGDGNLLLNVGPDSNGEIVPEQRALLSVMGDWLKRYGESVYGTRGGPYPNGAWGGTTRKGKTVYFHILDWGSGEIQLPPLPAAVMQTSVLQRGVRAEIAWSPVGLKLRLNGAKPKGPTTIKAVLDRDAWSLGTIR